MTVIVAAQSGNWSDASTWVGGVVPGIGDEARLAGFTIVQNITRIPATGRLIDLNAKDAGGADAAGSLTIDMAALGSCSVNADLCLAGTGKLLDLSGSAVGSLFTLDGSVQGGSAASAFGLRNDSTANILITGDSTGGSASVAVGSYQYVGTGMLTVLGLAKGGTHADAHGVYSTNANAKITANDLVGGTSVASVGLYSTGANAVTIITGNVDFSSGYCLRCTKAPIYRPKPGKGVIFASDAGTIKCHPDRGGYARGLVCQTFVR